MPCRSTEALSETARVIKDRGRGQATTNIPWTTEVSLPYLKKTQQLVKYLTVVNKVGTRPRTSQAAALMGTCSSADRYGIRAGLCQSGLQKEAGTILPSSAHKKYYLLWSSQLQQQTFFLCTALEEQNLKPDSTRQSCRLPLLKADSSDSLHSERHPTKDNTH